MRRTLASALCLVALVLGNKAAAIEVTASRSQRGAVVKIDGQLFAEYLTLSGHQPAIWPIIGPTGRPMTRSFPIGPLLETERDDHPHHHSLWFAHQDVNGHDFWLEPKPDRPPESVNVIRHVDFERVESLGDRAVLVTRNRWEAGAGNVVCEDQRTIVFGAEADSRWIDFSTKIIASSGPVTFGDIKDGTFSIRVAGSMKHDSGGQIVNSLGQTNKKAWGRPAEWVDYSGPVAGERVGIALLSHPTNFQHPCRWHVRGYGLFTANPFGERHFPKLDFKQRAYTIAEGDSLTLRYRVYLHKGDSEQADVAEVYSEFAESTTAAEELPVLFRDDFDDGMKHWEPTDAGLESSVWSIQSTADGQPNSYLRVAGKSGYQPPHRSPHSIVWLKDIEVKSFELTAKVQNTNVDAGDHRDLCLFWGYQDPAHFYYAHLGAKPDPHSSQIFIVNGADRKMITKNDSPGIPWTEGWHRVKVLRDSVSGSMQVFFDDIREPVMIAKDSTFTSGRIGLGTFDDNGNFDEVRLSGELVDESSSQ